MLWFKTGFGVEELNGIVKAGNEEEARKKWYDNRSKAGFKEDMDEEGGFDEVWAREIESDDYLIVVE